MPTFCPHSPCGCSGKAWQCSGMCHALSPISAMKSQKFIKKINSSHEPVVSEMGPEARGLANGITKLQLTDKMLNNCDYSLIQTASL